jgi:hypothetical protein
MTENLQKESLSAAYVRLVAAVAGVGVARPETDDDSVDLILLASGTVAPTSPAVGVQLKSTADPSVHKDGRLSFALGRKNYDDLRRPTRWPRILVVFVLANDPARWLEQSEEQTVVRRCAYWVSLRGFPPRDQQSITIDVPRENLLTPAAIRSLLEIA